MWWQNNGINREKGSNVCTCDIQFGHIQRNTHENTSLDYAQFEICAHKWVDISDAGYGVSLINNCKYGYRVKDDCISLNLLRSSQYPGVQADVGVHQFGYALYLHNSSFPECEVERVAYEYNYPVMLLPTSNLYGTLAQTDATNVVIESVKISENGEGVILRVYENKGKETAYRIHLGFEVQQVWETNLLEQISGHLVCENGDVTDVIHPFEIKTFLLTIST